jgi:hypothetical protein
LTGDFQLDAMTLMDQAVEDCIGERWLTEIRMPGVDG